MADADFCRIQPDASNEAFAFNNDAFLNRQLTHAFRNSARQPLGNEREPWYARGFPAPQLLISMRRRWHVLPYLQSKRPARAAAHAERF